MCSHLCQRPHVPARCAPGFHAPLETRRPHQVFTPTRLAAAINPSILHGRIVPALALGLILATAVETKGVPVEAVPTRGRVPSVQSTMPTELLVIDPSVDAYDTLVRGLRPGIETVVLDAYRDGLSQLSTLMADRPQVRVVHIVTHGTAGGLKLGRGWIRREQLNAHAARLSQWFTHFVESDRPSRPEILIYACNVAKGRPGIDFLSRLSELSGADVAGSDDPTGSTMRGGDWVLEQTTGTIESRLAFDSEALANYHGVLANYTVTTTVDVVSGADGETSLREAVIAANANPGPDTIELPAGTYPFSIRGTDENAALKGDLDFTDETGATTIQGAGAAVTIIHARDFDRVLEVHPFASVVLEDTTITGGSWVTTGGGILNTDGTATLNHCTVSGNSSRGSGGGIQNHGGLEAGGKALLTLTDSTISGNQASTNGGGILNYGDPQADGKAVVTLTDSTVSGNSAIRNGGGIRNLSGSATLTNSTVSGNSGNVGGGLYNQSVATLVDSTVSGNTARFGGGIHNASSAATLTLTASTVSSNSTTESAGGINNILGLTILTSSVISENFTKSGGGIVNQGGTVTMMYSTVSGNSASAGGGGIANNSFAYIKGLATLTIVASTISGNITGGSGGAIASRGRQIDRYRVDVSLTNSTVSGNTAYTGGGLYNYRADVFLTNSTVSGNSAQIGGGMSNKANSTVTFTNSIIADNESLNCAPDGSGFASTLINSGHNLADDVSCGSLPGNLTGFVTVLSNNGGPTLTHRLLPGSNAIDAITPCPDDLATDQRGIARPQGAACDIGAFESDDSDGDGIPDDEDAFPYDWSESIDSDEDGMGDNFENQFGFDPDDPDDATLDPDEDGKTNLEEFEGGSNPRLHNGTASTIQIINGLLYDEDR